MVSGYPGSPLGTFDLTLERLGDELAANRIVHRPGLNEELAAATVWGSQMGASIAYAGVANRVSLADIAWATGDLEVGRRAYDALQTDAGRLSIWGMTGLSVDGPAERGAMIAAVTASAGATTGGSPRERPRAALPPAAPVSITAAAARKRGTSQISHSEALTPYGGI